MITPPAKSAPGKDEDDMWACFGDEGAEAEPGEKKKAGAPSSAEPRGAIQIVAGEEQQRMGGKRRGMMRGIMIWGGNGALPPCLDRTPTATPFLQTEFYR